MHEIVAVHDRDPITPRESERLVSRRGRAAVSRASNKTNSRIAGDGLSDDRCAVISRGVIGDDELELAEALSAHRRDGVRQIGRAIMIGHDHADDGWPRRQRRC